MGLDYLMPESLQKNINNKAFTYFSNVQEGIDSDIIDTWEYIKKNLDVITISLLMICSSFLMFRFTDLSIFRGNYILLSLWSIAIFFLALIGMISFVNIIKNTIVPMGLGGSFRIFTTFVLFSPKGPLAAIGFICLCTSFFLRYKYLTI